MTIKGQLVRPSQALPSEPHHPGGSLGLNPGNRRSPKSWCRPLTNWVGLLCTAARRADSNDAPIGFLAAMTDACRAQYVFIRMKKM
jgi:hypothetical protein